MSEPHRFTPVRDADDMTAVINLVSLLNFGDLEVPWIGIESNLRWMRFELG